LSSLVSPALHILFFFACYVHHRNLHSFPTRRSSDLDALSHPKVVAIGEIGLDWVHLKDDAERAQSDALFIEQLEIARAHEVPLILHVVKAHARAVEILTAHGEGLTGMVHAFSG